MAENITLTRMTQNHKFNLGTANNCTKVTFPKSVKYISFKFPSAAGSYAFAGTDGGAIGSHAVSLAADAMIQKMHCHPSDANSSGLHEIYFVSSTGSTPVEIILERGD